MPTVEMKPLRISDAVILRRLGVYQGSLKKVESAIRKLLSASDQACLIVKRQMDNQTETGFIALVPDFYHAETGRLSLHVTHADLLPSLLEMAVHTAFINHEFLRIETLVSTGQNSVLPIYEAFGFQVECTIAGSAYRTPDTADQLQMSLLKTHNQFPGVGLVPYRLGLLSVAGTEERIEQIEFHTTGEPILQPYLRDLFHIWRLLDSEGRLLPSQDRVEAIAHERLPVMVQKAVDELKAYLTGERLTFDLDLDLSSGSDFQQSVWTVLRTIPFGTTVTYLDVALQLTDGDLKKARTMTRAVGSACGANPVPVIIPCHRVIGYDGRLTGFSSGIPNKEFLLALEMFGMRSS